MIFKTNLPKEFKDILSASKSDGQKSNETSPFKILSGEIDNELDDAKVVLKKRLSDIMNKGDNKLINNLKEKFGTSLLDDQEPE